MDLITFNKHADTAASMLKTACGSEKWVHLMMREFPFTSEEKIVSDAALNWYSKCDEQDWKEAFTHHPRIGDLSELEKKFASTKHLAGNEQTGVLNDHKILSQLLEANKTYENNFGFIFIIHASGKTGIEMLKLLNDRLENSPADEILIAMGEQHKITITRLKKILEGSNWSWLPQSHLTTHVLDTSAGKPAEDLQINLFGIKNGIAKAIAQGRTNSDGRLGDMLAPGKVLEAGEYKLSFDTGNYYGSKNGKSFYPRVEILFKISGNEHYHVPLLLNPFGYTTYRGS